MGTGKKPQQSAKNSKVNLESGDSGGGQIVDCKHIKHAINPGQVIRGVKDNELGVCEDCRANGTLAENEGGSVWICLKCGHQGCGRTSPEQHARLHGELERGELHCVAMEMTSRALWCYKCDSDLEGRPDGKLKTCMDHLAKLRAAQQPASGPAAAKPSSVAVATDVGATSSDSSNTVVSTVQHSSHPRGFRNLGNTCFFNAALQCLCQTPFIVEALEQCRATDRVVCVKPRYPSCSGDADTTLPYPADEAERNEGKMLKLEVSSPSGPMTNALLAFIKEARGASKHELSPKALFGQICDKAPRFRGFQQQDSHELLRYLLDGIKTEETKRIQEEILKQFKVKRTETDKVDEWVKRQVKAYGKGARHTLVDSFFGGHFISVITCLECRHMSYIFEPFLDISLPVFEDKIEPKHGKFSKQQDSNQEAAVSHSLDSLDSTPSTKQSKNSAKRNQKKARQEQRKGKRRKGQQPPRSANKEADGEADADDKNGEGEEHESDDADDEEQKDNADDAISSAPAADSSLDASSNNVAKVSSETDGGLINNESSESASCSDNREMNGLCDTLETKLSLSIADSASISEGKTDSNCTVENCLSNGSVDGLTSALRDKLTLEENRVDEDTAACVPPVVANTDSTTGEHKSDSCSAESHSSVPEDNAANSISQQDAATSQQDSSADNVRQELATSERRSSGSNDSGVSVDGSCSLSEQKRVTSSIDESGPALSKSSLTVDSAKEKAADSSKGSENERHGNASDDDDKDELDQTVAYAGDESFEFDDGNTTECNERELLLRALQPMSNTVRDTHCSIQASLHAFTAAERLTGANKFSCPKCSKRGAPSHGKKSAGGKATSVLTDADKKLLLIQPPAVLTLHLKRFQQTGYSLRKISKHIDFPLTLDLAPFTSSLYQARRYSDDEEQPSTLPYSLYGVVEHSGTMTGGHYVAYVRFSQHLAQHKDDWFRQLATYDLSGLHMAEVAEKLMKHVRARRGSDAETTADEGPQQQQRDADGGGYGQWYYVSDSSVRQCDISDVLRCNAYLLFYRRVVTSS